MKEQLLYRDLAKYYDLIYSWKDYKKEAATIEKIISKYKKSSGKNLLEVGCGTGHHLRYFQKKFDCTGIDINKDILGIAKKSAKNTRFIRADMIDFRLNRKFDIITSLFSSIGYVKTYANLKKTIFNISSHLKVGGVIIIEPWFTKSSFIPGHANMTTYDGKDTKICRMSISRVEGDISVLDMQYLVAQTGKGVTHYVDRHEMGLFDTDKTLEFMLQAGLKSVFLKNGLEEDRGLFVGVKQP